MTSSQIKRLVNSEKTNSKIMQDAINDLFQAAMKPIMQAEAKTHNGLFLNAAEFEKNMGRVFIITNAKRVLEELMPQA